MNEAERYMIKMLTGKDFGKAIEALSIAEADGRRYNRSAVSVSGGGSATRLLGRYRSMVLRKKRLDLKLRERLAFLAEAKKRGVEPSWLSVHREKNSILDMLRETVLLGKRIEKCEQMVQELPMEIQGAVRLRYLDMSERSMPDWRKTAGISGFSGSGEELRARVTRALSESVSDDS